VKSYRGPGVQLTDPHRTGTPVEMQQIDDGRWHHRFSQSWLNTAHTCPERARLEHDKEMPDDETDAANVGTALHTVAEVAVEMLRDDGIVLDVNTAVELWDREFEQLAAHPSFRYVKYSEKKAREFGHHCTILWLEEILPQLDVEHSQTEKRFIVPLVDDGERVIELSGSIDYVQSMIDAWDWKTSGRGDYVEWEKKRWAIQPTVYTYALAHERGWLTECDDCEGAASEAGCCRRFERSLYFNYAVMSYDGAQVLPIERGPEHWSWLADQCTRLALLIEREMPAWPTNDAHALCSPKWCPAWDACKGSHGITF
jgi:hypothetical protein